MIVAIELRPEPGGTENGNAVEIANRRGPAMYRTALERGVLLRPLGDLLYWMPPYCTDDEQLALLADHTGAATESGSGVGLQGLYARRDTDKGENTVINSRVLSFLNPPTLGTPIFLRRINKSTHQR